ncbi:MAG: carboxypeptidase regulatory-like domain-containing protein [Terriglobia bacterium]
MTILSSLVFGILLLAASLPAQVAGTMSGYVKDTSGAVIPDVTVTATLAARGTFSTTRSNTEGFYHFTTLEPGTYTLTAEKAGFKRDVRTGLTLTVRQNLRVDVTLEVGAVSQSVTVRSAAPLVDTTSGTVSGLVGPRRIVDLPLNGRNVIDLAQILPGVLNVSAPDYLTDVICGPRMNVNGGRGNWNFFTFDGAYFLNGGRNTGLNYPPPDAIQEFRMQTADFDAQYGFNPGSQMAVVSKSGTNQFHGDAYDFLRNTVLDTRNFFAPTVPGLIQNQFGGTAGGPIKKNKLFFFGSFQALVELPQAVTSEAIVPTPAERNGDFSALLPNTVLSDPVDPLTGTPFATSGGTPCVVNNIIAPSCINPAAQKLLSRIPQSSSGTVVSLAESPVHNYNYFGRLDANISPKNVIFGHAYVDHSSNIDPTAGGNFTTFLSTASTGETDMVTVNDTYTLKPNLVNQALVSFMRSGSRLNPNATLAPADLGINMPQYFPTGILSVVVPGAFTTDGAFEFNQLISNDYQFRDSLTWIYGRHTFNFGGDDLFPLSYNNFAFAQPTFTFNGSRSGNPLSDLMMGSYASLATSFGTVDMTATTNAPDLFFQDEFKATPRLTLTYGLRWEPNLFYSTSSNQGSTFVAGRQSVKLPDAPPGILFPGDPGVPKTIAHHDMNNLAPRFGFAWDVFGNGKTSIRGGAGIFFDHINGDTYNFNTDAPYTGIVDTYNGLLSDPFASVGASPPLVVPSGKFGCTKISTSPGVDCPLFPLPLLEYASSTTLQTPYVGEWNLDVERQVTPSTMIEVGYIGNRGIKLNNILDFNPARFIPGTSYNAATGVETTNSSLENVNNRAIYEPGIIAPFSWVVGNEWRSWYDSLQAQLTHRMSHGVSIMASYTLAKALDMCSYICEAGGTDSNPTNLRDQKGRADWDRRNAFVASYLWSPPVHFGDHWKNELLGGWTLSGITTFQSGAPVTFYSPIDVAVNGTTASEHAFLTGQRIGLSHPTVSEFFNTNALVNPLCTFVPQPFNPQVIQQESCTPDGINYSLLGKYGQSGRNILSGPGYSNTDFAILRDFTFKERYRAEFRAEFFNIFNQVNFGEPGNTVSSPTFGQLLSADPGRIIQFGLKFFW